MEELSVKYCVRLESPSTGEYVSTHPRDLERVTREDVDLSLLRCQALTSFAAWKQRALPFMVDLARRELVHTSSVLGGAYRGWRVVMVMVIPDWPFPVPKSVPDPKKLFDMPVAFACLRLTESDLGIHVL